MHRLHLPLCLAVSLLVACERAGSNPADSVPQAETTAQTAVSARCAPDDAPALSEGRVGNLRIGDTRNAIPPQCRIVRDTILMLEGDSQPALVIDVDGDTVIAEIVNDRIWRMSVITPGLRTVDSIAVGMPARLLPSLVRPLVSSGEGAMYLTTPQHCGLSFMLENLDFRVAGWTLPQVRALGDSVRISRILVLVGCHERLRPDSGRAGQRDRG